MNGEVEYTPLEAVYDVLYTVNNELRRVTVDHTAVVQVIADVMKTGFLVRVEVHS